MEEKKITAPWVFRNNKQVIRLGDTVYYIEKQSSYAQGGRKTKLCVKSIQVYTISANYINKDKCLNPDICPTFITSDKLYSTVEACQIAINNISDTVFVKDNLDKLSSSDIGHLAEVIRDSQIEPF